MKSLLLLQYDTRGQYGIFIAGTKSFSDSTRTTFIFQTTHHQVDEQDQPQAKHHSSTPWYKASLHPPTLEAVHLWENIGSASADSRIPPSCFMVGMSFAVDGIVGLRHVQASHPDGYLFIPALLSVFFCQRGSGQPDKFSFDNHIGNPSTNQRTLVPSIAHQWFSLHYPQHCIHQTPISDAERRPW